MRLSLEFANGSEKEFDVAAFYPVGPKSPGSYMTVTGNGVGRYDDVTSFHIRDNAIVADYPYLAKGDGR